MHRINEDQMIGVVPVERRMDLLDEDAKAMLRKSKARAIPDFCADMRKIIDNPDYSDVVFLCKDGARVHASRLFLVARSVVFRGMLLNGMVESQSSEIALHEFSSKTVLPVLEFLYTGTLEEHKPKDWQNAFEVIRAARFFLVEGMDWVVVDYLYQTAAEAMKDVKGMSAYTVVVTVI